MIKTAIPGFFLRPATREDVSLIVGFIHELAEYEKLADKATITEEQVSRFLFGSPAYAEVILAYEEDSCIGFALFFHNFSTFAGRPGLYLEDLFIRPAFRNKGYGKVIMHQLIRMARERGCARMEWSVLDWNAPSIGFYKSLGAVPMDEWTVFRLNLDEHLPGKTS